MSTEDNTPSGTGVMLRGLTPTEVRRIVTLANAREGDPAADLAHQLWDATAEPVLATMGQGAPGAALWEKIRASLKPNQLKLVVEYVTACEEHSASLQRAAFIAGMLGGNPGVLLLGKVSPMLDLLEAQQRRRGDN
jgi:hypothetical protein